MGEMLTASLQSVLEPRVLLIIVMSAAYGIFVGSIPGLTATMAVALLVPLTFFLSDVEALAAIVTTVTCSIFAGDIPATLVRIPGTPASAAYANDAYALTRRNDHQRALGVSLYFSVIGGLIGAVTLMIAAPQLARIAEKFTSYEYFWLYILGLTCAAIVSEGSRLKGAFALLLGILLSTVGLGTDYSVPRLTFGFDQLITGINFIPAMIGLFGVSEVLRNAIVLRSGEDEVENSLPKLGLRAVFTHMRDSIRGIAASALPLAWLRKWHLLRSSGIGSLIGMLPGAGADIAAWIAYAMSKRLSRHPEQYGRGSLEGIGDATGANNAALGAAWIPALVFGIPGDSVTAIAIGVLLMKNITPGPDIFNFESDQSVLVLAIFLTFILANIILLPLGMLAIQGGSLLVRVPRRVLLPVIMLFCIVGSYAMAGSYFDVWVMLAMGVLGFVLERFGIPLGPVVLGMILGSAVEHKFIQSLTKSDDISAFFAGPLRVGLALLCLALWCVPLLEPLFRKRDPARPGL